MVRAHFTTALYNPFHNRLYSGLSSVRARPAGCRQWRSQECELGGLPSLAPFHFSHSPLPSPPPFNGGPGYNPRKFS